MSEIQQGRWDQILRRLGDLKGAGSKANDLLSEVFPVIEVEQVAPEARALGGTVLGHAGTTLVAGAGFNAKMQIFNPLGSGKIATVTSALVSSNVVGTIQWGIEELARSIATGLGRVRDARFGPATSTTLVLRTEANADPGPLGGVILPAANTSFILSDVDGLAVLRPGSGLTITSVTAASTLRVTFFWRERVAEPSELNF